MFFWECIQSARGTSRINFSSLRHGYKAGKHGGVVDLQEVSRLPIYLVRESLGAG